MRKKKPASAKGGTKPKKGRRKESKDTSIELHFSEDGKKTQSVRINILGKPSKKSAKFLSELIDNQVRHGALFAEPAQRESN